MKKIYFLLIFIFSFQTNAQFVETKWEVTEFFGEAWFANPSDIIGNFQKFYKGYSEGVFYNCDYEGQSYTYTTYETYEEFLNNKEFFLFKTIFRSLKLKNEKIYVHRITCSGNSVFKRKVFYPFVTFDKLKIGFYLFEGAIYKLEYN